MARSLANIKLEVKLTGTLRNTLDDANVVSVNHPNLSYKPSMTDGIEDNQANRAWQLYQGSLASGASKTLDLYDMNSDDIGAGAGKDGLGQDVVFEEIVAVAIMNDNAVTAAGKLEVAPASSGGWTPIGTHSVATGGALGGQGLLLKVNPDDEGFDVLDGGSHRITLTANGGAVTYSVYILARHDDEVSSSSSSTSSVSSSSRSSGHSSQSSSSSSSSISSKSSPSSSSSSSTVASVTSSTVASVTSSSSTVASVTSSSSSTVASVTSSSSSSSTSSASSVSSSSASSPSSKSSHSSSSSSSSTLGSYTSSTAASVTSSSSSQTQ